MPRRRVSSDGLKLFNGDNTGDEVALTIAIVGLCVHLVLVLLHLLLNNTGCKDTCVSNLAGKEANCDEVGIHLPNEIPIVSKIVFTLVLGSLAIVVGERIHEQLDITLLIWILLQRTSHPEHVQLKRCLYQHSLYTNAEIVSISYWMSLPSVLK